MTNKMKKSDKYLKLDTVPHNIKKYFLKMPRWKRFGEITGYYFRHSLYHFSVVRTFREDYVHSLKYNGAWDQMFREKEYKEVQEIHYGFPKGALP